MRSFSLAHWPTSPCPILKRFGSKTPRSGSSCALDPDIPPSAQRIAFEGERGTWWLDGRRIGQGEKLSWAPWPGRHELRLLGAGGQLVQAVTFEVRGASLKPGKR